VNPISSRAAETEIFAVVVAVDGNGASTSSTHVTGMHIRLPSGSWTMRKRSPHDRSTGTVFWYKGWCGRTIRTTPWPGVASPSYAVLEGP
jgi:hypothetical protein